MHLAPQHWQRARTSSKRKRKEKKNGRHEETEYMKPVIQLHHRATRSNVDLGDAGIKGLRGGGFDLFKTQKKKN